MAEYRSKVSSSVSKTIEDTLKKRSNYKVMTDRTHVQLKLLAEFIATGDHGFDDNISSRYLKRLEQLTENQAKIESRIDVFTDYLEENRNTFSNEEPLEDDETASEAKEQLMVQSVEDQLEERVSNGYHKKLQHYEEVMEIIQRKDEDEDIALVNEGASHQLTCPITARLFDKPMKSTICGHIFESVAIKNHIRIKGASKRGSANKEADCPVSGCRKKVSTNILEEDVETIMLVKRHKKEMESQQQFEEDLAEDLTDI